MIFWELWNFLSIVYDISNIFRNHATRMKLSAKPLWRLQHGAFYFLKNSNNNWKNTLTALPQAIGISKSRVHLLVQSTSPGTTCTFIRRSVGVNKSRRLRSSHNALGYTNSHQRANRPDFFKGKKQGTCMLIDATVPSERNISAKSTGKFTIKTNLEIKINKIWKKKTETFPVAIGVLGLMKKGLDEISSRISGNTNTNKVYTMLETAHILRKVQSLKQLLPL